MVRFLLSILVLFALPNFVFAASRAEVYRQAKAATALIVGINDATRSISLGSGSFVGSDGLLITNAHVLEDSTRLIVYVHDQYVYPAPEIVTVDPDLDLAAVRISGATVSTLALANDPVPEGTDVIAVGYPRITDILQMGFALHPTVVTGTINGVAQGRSRTKGRLAPFLQTTGNFNLGNSGGPLVSLDSGEIVGMVVNTVPYLERAKDRTGAAIGSVTMRSGIGYSIPGSVIRQWLAANRLLPGSPRAAQRATDERKPTGPPEADRAFATGHLLQTLAEVLQQDADLLALAIHHYEAAAALRSDAPWIYRNLGLSYGAVGRWDQALRSYLRALELSPKDTALLTDAALAFERTGNRERAVESYRTALRIDSRFQLAHVNLGTLLWKMDRLDEATQEFRHALELDPTSAAAAYNLGLALETKGLREDAVTAWELFLRRPGLGPDPEGWKLKMREAVARVKPLLAARAHPARNTAPVQ